MTPINDNDTEKCEHCHETGGGHYWDCWYDAVFNDRTYISSTGWIAPWARLWEAQHSDGVN